MVYVNHDDGRDLEIFGGPSEPALPPPSTTLGVKPTTGTETLAVGS